MKPRTDEDPDVTIARLIEKALVCDDPDNRRADVFQNDRTGRRFDRTRKSDSGRLSPISGDSAARKNALKILREHLKRWPSIGAELAVLQWRCMSKVWSREIWVSDSRTISDGERNIFYRSVVCSVIDSIRSHC